MREVTCVVPEAGAGTQSHDLLRTSTETFYADTRSGTTALPRDAHGRYPCARLEDLRWLTTEWRAGESGGRLGRGGLVDVCLTATASRLGFRRPLPRTALGFGNLFSSHAGGNGISVSHGQVAILTGEL